MFLCRLMSIVKTALSFYSPARLDFVGLGTEKGARLAAALPLAVMCHQ